MKKLFPFLLLLPLLLTANISYGQDIIPLWHDQIPNFRNSDASETHETDDFLWIEQVQMPTMEIFLPARGHSTGQGVVICPGGGYRGLAYDWEGTDIAKWFNSKGIVAFVLKYRLPISESVVVPHEAPLQDAKRAIRIVRANAGKWNVNPDKIGVMGFSAGGHLASTLGTHFNSEDNLEKDSVDVLSSHPDFMILVYPVVTMKEPYVHKGSRANLIGENPSDEMIEYYSNETQVTQETPPTFLLHASNDEGVPVENSLAFYKALKDNGIPAEMHIYPEGGHGFALAIGKGHLQGWTDRLYDWLRYINK